MHTEGAEPEQVTFPDAERGERTHRWPTVLPNGDVVLFSVGTAEIEGFDEARIDALRTSTGERRTLVEGGMYPRYLPPGYLLYGTASSLMGIPFDERGLAIFGAAVPLVDGLKTLPHSGLAAVAVAPDGSLLTGLGEPLRGARRLVLYDRDGTVDSLTDEIRPYLRLALSPDESTVALEINGANASVWLLDLERDIQTRLTTRWSHNVPVWSPDSKVLVTSSSRGDTYRIHRHEIGTGRSEVLHESRRLQFFASSWSVDGNLAVTAIPIGGDPDIWIVPVADPSRAEPLVSGPYLEQEAEFSPDGRWVAFVSDETGR
ncbi:MAG: hypothetical protein R3324_21595, partial [Halobacteriales archaeon]|nr:hypothetical protein [Halobacteriales archaeon]